ncbi:hypothetical protein TrRE_jg11790, partial [Triparma retinervis]
MFPSSPHRTFARNSACLSAGGVRTAFTVKENVLAGMEGLSYYRDGGWERQLHEAKGRHGGGRGEGRGTEGGRLQFQEGGYMFLAGTSAGMDALAGTSEMREGLGLGPSVIMEGGGKVEQEYPYIDAKDLEGAAVTKGDGWFD